jgi:hypothetical protein
MSEAIQESAREGPKGQWVLQAMYLRQVAEDDAGLNDRSNSELRVKWINTLRKIVGERVPKNASGVPLVSDVDLLLATEAERWRALDAIKA